MKFSSAKASNEEIQGLVETAWAKKVAWDPCIRALGNIGDERVVNPLIEMLDRGDARMRIMAIEALGKTKSKKAADRIVKELYNVQSVKSLEIILDAIDTMVDNTQGILDVEAIKKWLCLAVTSKKLPKKIRPTKRDISMDIRRLHEYARKAKPALEEGVLSSGKLRPPSGRKGIVRVQRAVRC